MKRHLLLCLFVFASFWAAPTFAQADSSARATSVDHTNQLQIGPLTVNYGPPVLFLFGAFCALWAQNTERNAWLWFFLGLLFSVVTIFFLLTKNANDIRRRKMRETISGAKPGS